MFSFRITNIDHRVFHSWKCIILFPSSSPELEKSAKSSYEVWVWVLGKIMNSLISFHKNYLVLAFVIWCLHRRIYCVIWKMHQAVRSRTGPESVIDWKYLAKSFSSCAFLYLLTERWSLSEVLREDFGFCLQVYLLS